MDVNADGSAVKTVMFSADGTFLLYDGWWRNKKFHGEGILRESLYRDNRNYLASVQSPYTDGAIKLSCDISRYSGSFNDGVKHGIGKEFDGHDQLVYEGGFKNGHHCGNGKEYFSNGVLKYDGLFNEEGQYHGEGVLYDYHGRCLYKGTFSANRRFGDGSTFLSSHYFYLSRNYGDKNSGDDDTCYFYCHLPNCEIERLSYGDMIENSSRVETLELFDDKLIPSFFKYEKGYICRFIACSIINYS